MAYGSGNSNIKMTPLSLTDANAWRDVLGWEINDGGASVDVGMAYSAVGWVNRCVHLRAGALKELPWSLMKGDSEIANSESEDYSFLPWLESLPDLLYLAESALCITGTAYIGKVRNRGKRIEDLRWFAPSTMEPIWSPVDGLIGYKRTIGSTGGGVSVQPWAVENIIYFHILNPLHETEPGASPVAAALLDAQVIYNLNQYSSLFFQRGAIKPTLLTVEGMPPPAERERLKAWWQRAFSGVKNAFNTEIISASVKPIVVGEGLEALNNNSLTEEKREAISTALGVPHSMVMSNASNFATAEADRLNLYDTTIIPRAKTIANSLNRQLFTELGYRIVFKPESLSIYQEDEEQRAGALVQLVNAGMKLSVAAEILGIGLPDGVTYESLDEAKQQADAAQQALLDAQLAKQQQSNTSSDNAQDANQPKANAADNTQAKTKEAAQFRKWLKKRDNADIHMFKAEYLTHDELHEIADDVREVATEQPFFTLPETFTRESVKALILQLSPDDDEAEQKIRMGLEGKISNDLSKSLEQWLRETLRGISDDEVTQIASRLRDKSTTFRDVLQRALVDSVDLGVSVSVSQLENVGFGFDWTLANSSARDWARQYTDNLMSRLNITNDRVVGEAVARWVDNGEPLSSLRTDLSQYFSRKRADLIASTEVTRAYAEGSSIAFRESGVVDEIEWRTASDELVCPTCGPLNGKRKRIGESFDIMFPVPPAHPRCRCWIVPVVNSVQNENQKNLLPNDIKPSLAVANNTKKLKPNIEHALESIDKTHGDGSLNSVPVVEKSFKNSRLGGQMTYSGNQVERIEMNSTASQSVSDASGFTFSHEFGHVIDVNVLKLEKAFKENRIKGIDLPEHIKKWDDAVKNSSHYQRLKELRYKSKTIDLDVDGEKRSFPVDKKYVNYLMQENELWARSYSQFVAKRSSSKELMSQMKNVSDFAAYPFQWNDDDFLEVEKAIEGVFVALGWLK